MDEKIYEDINQIHYKRNRVHFQKVFMIDSMITEDTFVDMSLEAFEERTGTLEMNCKV